MTSKKPWPPKQDLPPDKRLRAGEEEVIAGLLVKGPAAGSPFTLGKMAKHFCLPELPGERRRQEPRDALAIIYRSSANLLSIHALALGLLLDR